MQKWEYEYRRFDLPSDIASGGAFMAELEKLGNEGWELIHSFEHRSVDPNGFWHVMCVFKRPKAEYANVTTVVTEREPAANDALLSRDQSDCESG